MASAEVSFCNKLIDLPYWRERYIILYGGRGSSKSWAVAQALIIRAVESKLVIMCTREIQNSIGDSVHQLLTDTIDRLQLGAFFEITENKITGKNGSVFKFKGLYRNIDNIKSFEGADICWIEEGQNVSEKSLEKLIPTIRKDKSQLIITFNPENEDDPVYTRFVKTDREEVRKVFVNYWDNPYFPQPLRLEMEYDKEHDYDKYLHVWCGECRKVSEAQVFNNIEVKKFEPHDGPIRYYGADWGFYPDPTTMVEFYIIDKTLYITREIYFTGKDKDYFNELLFQFNKMQEAKRMEIVADCARPEIINHLRINGFNRIVGSQKWPGCKEDGVEYMRSLEKIIISDNCPNCIREFKGYSHIIDKRTGVISTKLQEEDDHTIDAVRYGLEKFIRRRGCGIQKVVGW